MNTGYLLNQYIILYILYIHPTPAYRNILSDNSGFYILYLIHVWYLRIGYLLNSMSGLKTRCHSYRCVLCGQGSLYSNIKKMFHKGLHSPISHRLQCSLLSYDLRVFKLLIRPQMCRFLIRHQTWMFYLHLCTRTMQRSVYISSFQIRETEAQ